MDLLPGLPNDLAIECILRIPSQSLVTSSQVSLGWKAEIESPDFIHRRKAIGSSRVILVVVHTSRSVQKGPQSEYKLASYEPETGEWSDLPQNPYFPKIFLRHSHLVAVGSKVVVLTGGKPSYVYIYNFLSMTWRRGAPMPHANFLFACASNSDQTVYITCGSYDVHKIYTKAFAYNVEEDMWTQLPEMNTGRVFSTGIFQDDKFHVIGGLPDKFLRSKEAFDVAMWQWGMVEEDFLEKSSILLKCFTNQHNGKIYMCHEGNVNVLEDAIWRVLVRLPNGMNKVSFIATWQDKLLVIGCSKHDQPHSVYVFDTESYIWTKIDTPKSYLGYVRLGCHVDF